MTDNKLTDNETMKALELFKSGKDENFAFVSSNALDLINRKNAEIERLNRILNTDVVVFRGGRGNGKSETIRKIIEARVAEIRAKAYKECIEKAKEILHNYCIELVDDDLDNLVKEKAGD